MGLSLSSFSTDTVPMSPAGWSKEDGAYADPPNPNNHCGFYSIYNRIPSGSSKTLGLLHTDLHFKVIKLTPVKDGLNELRSGDRKISLVAVVEA